MAKTIYLNKWDGGMTNDPRDPRGSVGRLTQHFDNYTNSYKLSPHRDAKLDATPGFESTLNELQISKFANVSGSLYGFGVVSSVDSHAQVYVKTTASDPTAVWTAATGGHDGSSSGGARNDLLFVNYHNVLYGGNNSGIWKYDIAATTFTYNEYTLHSPSAQGLVHSKDDILYIPSGNQILRNNNGSWDVPLTLPTNSTITSICEFGNYLAIACDQPDGTSVVYLWDRDASLTTLSEKIDWGAGSLKVIETIGGVLTGISVSAPNFNTSLTPLVYFKYWTGSRVVTFQSWNCSFATIYSDRQKFNDLLYFMAEITLGTNVLRGIWKIHKDPSGSMAVSFDRSPRNATALNSGALKGFMRIGDYVFVAYLNPADSGYTVWRTNDQASFTATSTHETTVNPGMEPADRPQKKELISVGALYEALPSGSAAVVKYRVDGGAWKTIFTENTTGRVRTEPFTRDSVGQFDRGAEFEFHIESTGGAEISGLVYKYEIIPTNT
jgi:hypothetical protein